MDKKLCALLMSVALILSLIVLPFQGVAASERDLYVRAQAIGSVRTQYMNQPELGQLISVNINGREGTYDGYYYNVQQQFYKDEGMPINNGTIVFPETFKGKKLILDRTEPMDLLQACSIKGNTITIKNYLYKIDDFNRIGDAPKHVPHIFFFFKQEGEDVVTLTLDYNGGTYNNYLIRQMGVHKGEKWSTYKNDSRANNGPEKGDKLLGYTTVRNDKNTLINDDTTFDKDTTLYALWTSSKPPIVAQHTVHFDLNGENIVGQAPADQTVEDGTLVKKPENPKHVNDKPSAYTVKKFDGWYKEKECKTPWNFEEDKVTADTTLYAKWVTAYRVEFIMQGKGTNRPQTQFIKEGETVAKPTNPTDKDYDFAGWYKEQACTNPWNFETDKVTNWVLLYAKWVKKAEPPVPGKHTVTFDLNGEKLLVKPLQPKRSMTAPSFQNRPIPKAPAINHKISISNVLPAGTKKKIAKHLGTSRTTKLPPTLRSMPNGINISASNSSCSQRATPAPDPRPYLLKKVNWFQNQPIRSTKETIL